MSEHINLVSALLQHPVGNDCEAWCIYWISQGQPWRTSPEIDKQRQEQLVRYLAVVPDVERSIYPFKHIKLSRADVEWLISEQRIGLKRVHSNETGESEGEGLDLRGADLSGEDLSGLPLTHLQGGLTVRELGNTTPEQRSTAAIHLEGASLINADLERANLHSAHLERASLIEAHLGGANLDEAHLEKSSLFQAHLHGASLSFAHLEGANLIRADMEEANLSFAHLQGTLLSEANLEGTNLMMAHLEGTNLTGAHLEGARMQRVTLDSTTVLKEASLSDGRHKCVFLADVRWGGVNLTDIDWSFVKVLGDENEARQRKARGKRVKEKTERLDEFKVAVHANRQLAQVLRSQGMNEEADHFAYRAQLLQRVVYRRQLKLLKYAFAWFLYLLAGHGYRPLRSLFIYLLVILSFAAGYYWTTHFPHAHPLNYYEALVLSINSFHGRGFFQPTQSPGDPVALLAAIEGVFGLLIEISFIATFTQRYFGR
jgi:uncharacterized protein YjbI with pentapeptide repeats